MTLTEFRRRCNLRRRMVRVVDTDVYVYISSAQAEMLWRRLDGHVVVYAPPADGLGAEGYAWIRVEPGMERAP